MFTQSRILITGSALLALTAPAAAADLIIQPSPGVVTDVSYSAGGDWEGAFIGAFGGYGWGTVIDETATGVVFTDTLDELGVSGWLAGVDAGVNFYLSDGIVAGIVGDIAWSDIGGYDVNSDTSFDVNWAGSVRGRVGFDGGAFLPYLTGGLAVANATANYSGDEDNNTHIGWTVGAGVEIAATEDLSIDLQYRYSDYGTKTYEIVPDADLHLTTHQVTAGLHWKF